MCGSRGYSVRHCPGPCAFSLRALASLRGTGPPAPGGPARRLIPPEHRGTGFCATETWEAVVWAMCTALARSCCWAANSEPEHGRARIDGRRGSRGGCGQRWRGLVLKLGAGVAQPRLPQRGSIGGIEVRFRRSRGMAAERDVVLVRPRFAGGQVVFAEQLYRRCWEVVGHGEQAAGQSGSRRAPAVPRHQLAFGPRSAMA